MHLNKLFTAFNYDGSSDWKLFSKFCITVLRALKLYTIRYLRAVFYTFHIQMWCIAELFLKDIMPNYG